MRDLYIVYNRRPLGPRERKTWTARYAAIAESAEEAIEAVKEEHCNYPGSWSAELLGNKTWGPDFYSSEPTAEEIQARKNKGD